MRTHVQVNYYMWRNAMKALGWIILGALVLLAFFAVANWSLLTAPATLDFLAFTVQGPLGLIMVGVTIGFAALFGIYALSLRTSALVETRRHTRELQAQRDLADKAEASRFTALGASLEQEFARVRGLIEECRTEARQHALSVEASLKNALSETANELFAHIGEVDDKLDRLAPGTSAGPRP
jgi:uncharacterized integral membrane protein